MADSAASLGVDELYRQIRVTLPDSKWGDGPARAGPDLALLYGMERTLFSALNLALFVHIFGVGIWMADFHDAALAYVGGSMIVASALMVAWSYADHARRFRRWRRDNGGEGHLSACWTAGVCAVLFAVLSVELAYAVVHPYLHRSIPVVVDDAP